MPWTLTEPLHKSNNNVITLQLTISILAIVIAQMSYIASESDTEASFYVFLSWMILADILCNAHSGSGQYCTHISYNDNNSGSDIHTLPFSSNSVNIMMA